jgi:hypothetical protein
MVLFLVVSALWLVAAGTAQAGVEIQPCIRRACPQPPSYASLHVWLLLGIAGAVLTLASFVLVARRAVGERPTVGTAHQVRRAVMTGFAGAVAEVLVVFLVTQVAIITAPLGFENSGETAAPIGILGVAQPALAGALALVWGGLLRVSPGKPRPSARRIRPWSAVLGLGGMVLGCGAFAAWSLRAGTTPLVVNTSLIGGPAWTTNVGAWWPGLFAAMLALTLVAAACAPGMTSTAEGKVPRVPSASDRTASPASAPYDQENLGSTLIKRPASPQAGLVSRTLLVTQNGLTVS